MSRSQNFHTGHHICVNQSNDLHQWLRMHPDIPADFFPQQERQENKTPAAWQTKPGVTCNTDSNHQNRAESWWCYWPVGLHLTVKVSVSLHRRAVVGHELHVGAKFFHDLVGLTRHLKEHRFSSQSFFMMLRRRMRVFLPGSSKDASEVPE